MKLMGTESIMFSLIRSEICGIALEESIKTELSAKIGKDRQRAFCLIKQT